MIRRSLPRAVLLAVAVTLAGAGCSTSSTDSDDSNQAAGRPRVVVTFPVLGSVVRQVVGDAATVTVLMPNGADPHEWSPSAKDIQALLKADLVVENGLGLERNLQDPLQQARSGGVDVFAVADHVTVRTVSAGEGAEPADPDRAPGAQDPHFWMDPLTMKEWVQPLAAALDGAGVDAGANATRVEAELEALDGDLRTILDAVPAERRKLVTGHESLGYFARRYSYQLIGAVVPSVSSQAEASAGQLAELTRKVEAAEVPSIFTELGTPAATIEAIGRDAGVAVVELSTHTLPDDGSYRTFMLDIAKVVARGLTRQP
jgi:zinc/manganese transport system substrate-binding protein